MACEQWVSFPSGFKALRLVIITMPTTAVVAPRTKPGLPIDAAQEFGIDLAASYVVGGRWRDVAATQVASCKPVFIDRRFDETPTGLPPHGAAPSALSQSRGAVASPNQPGLDIIEASDTPIPWSRSYAADSSEGDGRLNSVVQ